ncbi:MAG TPA: FAD-dependent oxidoreductase [Candidatus Omnitrophica bacterium]|nr:FAD-dependent oxidoreductase [Candidatus Omnitrophota bacterium]
MYHTGERRDEDRDSKRTWKVGKKVDIAIVGAGPAGLSAGIEVAKKGAKVVIIDENEKGGGNRS